MSKSGKCWYCGAVLVRKQYGTRRESTNIFAKRKFCNQVCMALDFVGRDRGGVSDHQSRTEASKLIPPGKCQRCGERNGRHVHHKDGNPQNNDLGNLTRVCIHCHRQLHVIPRTCKICGKPHKGHGYCNMHYQRFKRHGELAMRST